MNNKLYIDKEQAKNLFIEWDNYNRPQTGPLWQEIWLLVINSVKANIGKLERRYSCKYANYDDKVMDTTIYIIDKILKSKALPENIIAYCYWPTLQHCCDKHALQTDFEENTIEFNDVIYNDN